MKGQTEKLPEKKQTQSGPQMQKKIEDKIYTEIRQGIISIRETPLHISFEKELQNANIMDKNLGDKIGDLHEQLQDLYNKISDKRKKDRQIQEQKRRQAVAVVVKLRKKKRSRSEYLKLNDSLLRSSEKKLAQMVEQHRQFHSKRVRQRKSTLQSRIEQNLSRRYDRQKNMLNNEIQYWSRIQTIEKKKRHNSVHNLLPRINQYRQGNNKNDFFGAGVQIPRKNSDALLKKKGIEQKLQYQDIVHKFLQRAKVMQQKSRIKVLKESKVSDSVNPQNYENHLASPSFSYIYSSKRTNLLGNQYLKQSVALAIKNQKKQQPIINEEKLFLLQSSKKILSKNKQVSDLEEKRKKILGNTAAQKITKQQANEELRKIDQHLDNMDPAGMETRIKEKLQIFQSLKNNQKFFISQPGI